uniref:Uncharacterized protein n=1 Tax=Ascaris lumbricoides TaxID=6252 RepID=A0A0M3HZL4_ASCLU
MCRAPDLPLTCLCRPRALINSQPPLQPTIPFTGLSSATGIVTLLRGDLGNVPRGKRLPAAPKYSRGLRRFFHDRKRHQTTCVNIENVLEYQLSGDACPKCASCGGSEERGVIESGK